MFTTKGLNHITLHIEDLERSLVFYQEILRMTLVQKGPDYAYLESGTTWFCLSHKPSTARVEGEKGVHHIALTVAPDEFEEAVEHLRSHGVPIVREPVLRGVGRAVNFLDPDGVQWEFHCSNLAERMTVIQEMEREKFGSDV
ncbi:VOC family protein [Tumebacillus sp. ITR2]|uniref:VOC family protein n=1 Tax=Tumebacillus amylolyticus TaxID=2801339 RepID=A0ABS1J6I1_9BACL|nr:VOC family protein [Tumebacillus amylolyticus]MBL0385878.1 VOC family protein [Tumebacillus amylolyticus]